MFPSFDLYIVSVQSASKTWLANSGIESISIVADCGSHVNRVVFWIGFFFVVPVVSFVNFFTVSGLSVTKIWLAIPGIESGGIVSVCGSHMKRVLCSGTVSPFPRMSFSFNNLHTVSVLCSMQTWLVSSGIESVCIATDSGPHVTRVVSMNGSVSAAHDVSYDSHFTGLELSAVQSLMVRLVSESVYKVTDCGSHVKHVVSRDETSLAVDGVTSASVCTAMVLSVLPEQLVIGLGLITTRASRPEKGPVLLSHDVAHDSLVSRLNADTERMHTCYSTDLWTGRLVAKSRTDRQTNRQTDRPLRAVIPPVRIQHLITTRNTRITKLTIKSVYN